MSKSASDRPHRDRAKPTAGEAAYHAGWAFDREIHNIDGPLGKRIASPRYLILKPVSRCLAERVVATLTERPDRDTDVNMFMNPVFAILAANNFTEPQQIRIDEQIATMEQTATGDQTLDALVVPLACEAIRVRDTLIERESPGDNTNGLYYVALRFFPGLKRPFPFEEFVCLPDDRIDTQIEDHIRQWAADNSDQLANAIKEATQRRADAIKQQSRRRTGTPNRPDLLDLFLEGVPSGVITAAAHDHSEPAHATGKSPVSSTLAIQDAIKSLAAVFRAFLELNRPWPKDRTTGPYKPRRHKQIIALFECADRDCAKSALGILVDELRASRSNKDEANTSADKIERWVAELQNDARPLKRMSGYLRDLLTLMNHLDAQYDQAADNREVLTNPTAPLPEWQTPLTKALKRAIDQVALWHRTYLRCKVPMERRVILSRFQFAWNPATPPCWPDCAVKKVIEELTAQRDIMGDGLARELGGMVSDFYDRGGGEHYNIERQFAEPLSQCMRDWFSQTNASILAMHATSSGDTADQQPTLDDITTGDQTSGDNPTGEGQSYTKSDLLKMTGQGETNLLKFIKVAGVEVSTRGGAGKGRRYSLGEVRKILIAFIGGTQDIRITRRCEEALSELP